MTNEIEEIHDWMIEDQDRKNALETAAGHPWALHSTESGMCMAEKICVPEDVSTVWVPYAGASQMARSSFVIDETISCFSGSWG